MSYRFLLPWESDDERREAILAPCRLSDTAPPIVDVHDTNAVLGSMPLLERLPTGSPLPLRRCWYCLGVNEATVPYGPMGYEKNDLRILVCSECNDVLMRRTGRA